jgi:DNA-binding transcriptional regulator YbjK
VREKVKDVTVTYPENMEELTKNYSKSLARVLIKIVPPHQIDELIKRLEEKAE